VVRPQRAARRRSLGPDDPAAEWLDRAWHVHDPGVSEIYFSPFVVRYKGDPDFAAFCRKIGLPVPGESSRDKTA
jgi:hypothetical protein